MPDWFPAFYAEAKAFILAAWPEITEAQYFTSLQFLKDNLTQEQNRAKAGEAGRVEAPYAIFSVGRFPPEEAYGLGSRIKRADVRIWYIDLSRDRDNQAFLQGKLYDLAQAIDSPDFAGTTFQPEGTAEIDASENSELTATFLESKLSLIGGVLMWPGWLVGEVGPP